ncbi:retrovirus-related pol polyprotein from transposon TNT 1-94 [Tanacetum coccineum]|uniref:Retrovirus-related pol polyprotein from transposon TNT 1-94 n=1 Tax=Tanacetum coccineum TaxID=301880 RepID=A0ABQ5EE98_9ASTR
MANLKYSDKHNMVAFLKKPNESVGFTEVVDFLKGASLRYALTHNPTIYDSLVKQFWQTATVKTLANGTQQLIASINSKEYTIIEAFVRSKLQLADATGIHNLSDAEIYAGLATLGYLTEGGSYGSRSYEAPLPEGNTSGSAEDSMQLQELMVLVPTLVTKINSLKKELKETKQTLGNAVVKLVKKVKSLETALKRKSKKVLISESEGEESEDQGRKIQDINDDPLVSLVRESMKEMSTDFVTLIKASEEAQEEEISPTILEAAKTLSKVASQGVSKEKSTDKGKGYRRGARSMAKKIDTRLDAEEEINTSREDINTGIEEVSTGSTKVDSGTASKRGQREGKAPMVEEDIQATHKTKEQMRQEEAGLEEAIKLQAQLDEEVAKQIHLDKMIAKRMAEEEALSEQQKKRKAQVQFEAQYYTEEDWDAIRAKLEANAELTKDVLGKDLPEQDFAKRMVDMVNQRKKHFAEERAKAKRNKPMTQSQLRIYMSNYLKNQGTWKLSQLKKLKFEEIKEEFDKLVQQIDTFVPMDFEATKEKLKRYGEELQTKTSKKQKIDDKDVPPIGEKVAEVKEEEPVKRTGKRKKQKARKERKNRTLIEAARTMLADSLLPIPFWAEAVNTACYVLNRVLVTKPQNKTPYELLIGKFNGKSDEGYLLGYSTSSKAFRVYNKRVEENLHINFLEDQPNVAGTGPNWMFDLDFLTNSMNYIPVSVENQVIVDAGTQDSYVAGSSGKDKGPTQEYILLPLQPHRIRILVKDVVQDAQEQPSENASLDKGIQDLEDVFDKEGQHQKLEDEQNCIPKEGQLSTDRPFVSTDRSFVSTDRSNTPNVSVASTSTCANANESSFVYLGGKIPIDASTFPNADLPIDLNMPDLEDVSDTLPNDGIFNRAYDDDEDVGAVADFNNMDNTIAVSPIPTLIIHKDHPKGQILRDPTSAVQIRGKIQNASSAQQALVSASLDRKLTTGGCQFLGKRLILGSARSRQYAYSTTEAYYVSMLIVVGKYYGYINNDGIMALTSMNTVNPLLTMRASLCVVKNPVYHSRTKHIKIRHHFIRDCYEKRLIDVLKIHTNLNVADLLTKDLIVSSLTFWRVFNVDRIGLRMDLDAEVWQNTIIYGLLFWGKCGSKTTYFNTALDHPPHSSTTHPITTSSIAILPSPHTSTHHSFINSNSTTHSPHFFTTSFFTNLGSYEAPLPEGNTSGSAEDSMQLKELMVLVPTLVTRINSLEKELKETKQTLGNAMVKLEKKVKSLEKSLKRKSKKVLIYELEGKESEDQGRKI